MVRFGTPASLARCCPSHRERFGAPEELFVEYRFQPGVAAFEVTVQWFRKPASRLPEAFWFSFAPAVAQPERWTMDKLGSRISPLDVIRNGNRNLHAVGRGVDYAGRDGAVRIESLDAPLVAPGAPRLLRFDNAPPDLAGGFHFDLYNNVWGTNFPMWYEDDARFRFRVETRARRR